MVFNQSFENRFVGFARTATTQTVPNVDTLCLFLFSRRQRGLDRDHAQIATFSKGTLWIPNIGDAT